MNTDFESFPKMARFSREVVITEKIDGTNAQILIVPTKDFSCDYDPSNPPVVAGDLMDPAAVNIYAGSRTRWLQPGKVTDNYGFAQWVAENAEDLKKLGPGRHFGEWWGAGIQRRYGQAGKHFSLFNASRWHQNGYLGVSEEVDGVWRLGPVSCGVVPTLYRGEFTGSCVYSACDLLRSVGSVAAPGFRDPEGIIVYHTAGKVGFKKTLKNDSVSKSSVTTNQLIPDSL